MKHQLVHIHGGEWFDSYEAYIDYLRAYEIGDPNEPSARKWRDRYEEFLGESWQIIRPEMPSSRNAKYNEWKIWFEKYAPYLHDEVTLVGHSLGATFLAQYLSHETVPYVIRALHLVAPAFEGAGGFGLDDELATLGQKVPNIYLYHSKDDTLVPYEDSLRMHALVPEAELITFSDRGHMLQPDFPELMERITT